jgi:hypothetical protein
MWHRGNGQKCGLQEHGTSFTTMHSSHSIVDLRVLGEAIDSCPSTTPYSPDLSPPNYFLFPKIKRPCKE